jgi:hypothetical protein
MRRLAILAAAGGIALGAAAPATASAADHYIGCNDNYEIEPRECFFVPHENATHAESLPVKNMRWRSWGGARAFGRGVYYYNSNYRAPGPLPGLPARPR